MDGVGHGEQSLITAMTILEIVDWDELYENHESRKLKYLRYVLIPNKHDGGGFLELMDHEDGDRHFAAWVLMLQLASKSRERGKISRDTGKFSRITGMRREIFDAAIPRLLNIGWIRELHESPGEPGKSPGMPGESPGEGKGMEGNGMEGKGRKAASASSSSPSFKWLKGQKAQLAEQLAKQGMSTNPTAIDEWIGALKAIAKVKSIDEACSVLVWAQRQAKRSNEVIRYAREAEGLMRMWDETRTDRRTNDATD
jgi:hypothetical protein